MCPVTWLHFRSRPPTEQWEEIVQEQGDSWFHRQLRMRRDNENQKSHHSLPKICEFYSLSDIQDCVYGGEGGRGSDEVKWRGDFYHIRQTEEGQKSGLLLTQYFTVAMAAQKVLCFQPD